MLNATQSPENPAETETETKAGAGSTGRIAPLRLAYLVNTYPGPSMTFIRRELVEVEARGATIERFALRRFGGELTDPMDQDESRKTRAVLEVGATGLLRALASMAVARPVRFLGALRRAIRLGRRGSGSGVIKHLIYLSEACVLVGWCGKARVEHVHTHFGTNSATVALLLRLLGGPPYSLMIHGSEEYDQPRALALDEKIDGAAFVAAISEHGSSQLRRWAPYEQWSKIHVIHCGLDSMFLNAPRRPFPTARRFVWVGRFVEQKGLPILIEAAGRLRCEGLDFEVVLVGDGPLRGVVESLIERLDLRNHVQLVGWRTNAEVRDLIQSGRAMVLSSFAEGIPVVVMEAMALGRPTIATWITGTPELVLPGVTGWLVPPASVDGLCQAMREALEADIEDLERMGRAGAERVAERHNIAIEARKLIELIRLSLQAPANLAPELAGSPEA